MSRVALDVTSGADVAPIHLVHGVNGTIVGYRALATLLGQHRPCYGLEARGVDGRDQPLDCVAALAAAYIDEICAAGAPCRWLVAGWSFGGLVAYEMALQLERAGVRACAAVIDTRALLVPRRHAAVAPGELDPDLAREAVGPGDVVSVERRKATRIAHEQARLRYRPGRLRAPLVVFRADHGDSASTDPTLGFGAVAAGRIHAVAVPGDHITMLSPPHVGMLARELSAWFHAFEQA